MRFKLNESKQNEEWAINQVLLQFGSSTPGVGCSFITPEGRFVNIYPTLATHEDLCYWVEAQANIELPYEDEEYFVREYNWIRLRQQPYTTSVIELPPNRIKTAQENSLEAWIDDIGGDSIYICSCDSDKSATYYTSETTSDEMIKKIRRFYSSGILYESTEQKD